MEGAPKSELTAAEEAMYEKFITNPEHKGMTKGDFKEFRDLALSARSPRIREFFSGNGVIMEERPNAEDIHDKFE